MQVVSDTELVIGIVGRMGVNTSEVVSWLTEVLHGVRYDAKTVKITEYLKSKEFDAIELGGKKFDAIKLDEKTIEGRYESYISACNRIREISESNDFFASYAIQTIIQLRESISGSPDKQAKRTAFIVDQLKRPEEVEALRSVYGQQFILVSCHMPMDRRQDTLARKIAEGHASAPKSKEWQHKASELIRRDEKESSLKYGQRVSDVFPLADLIIDTSDRKQATDHLERFFGALFGNFFVSPTKSEFAQNIAFNVALTSCDTARQVGAVITKNGEILSTGFNEAPRPGGGTYWSGEATDGRDLALGKDVNTVRKRQMVTDIVKLLRDNKMLANNEVKDHDLEDHFLDSADAPLKKSQIMDTLEYGRAVHAEMAALSSASRQGLATQDGVLHCTTFPCHNCSKHIVASGIREVYYLEPYGKSFADELYPDSISIDSSEPRCGSVIFRQFIGITPNRFSQIFSKEKLKDHRGIVKKWDKATCQPVFGEIGQSHIDREVIFQKAMRNSFDEEKAKYLGLVQSK